MRDNQWNTKKAAAGYKIKKVRWYMLLDAFMRDISDTKAHTTGARMTALMKKAKIKDTVQANQKAIDSDICVTSEASEVSEDLLKGAVYLRVLAMV